MLAYTGVLRDGNAFSLRALTNELDRVSVRSLVAYRMTEKSTHQIPNLRSCCFRPPDPVQPLLDCHGLDLFQFEFAPTGQHPVIQIASIGSARRKRLVTVAVLVQLLETIVSNQFSDRCRPALPLRQPADIRCKDRIASLRLPQLRDI